jgi:uncharacterized protein YkwD
MGAKLCFEYQGLSRVAVTLTALVALLAGVLAPTPVMAGPYLDFATSVTAHPPAGSMFRPDLEDELLRLANAYRSEKGKKPLQAGDFFVTAARAHAADMMLNNFMGHRASTGHDFSSRMAVFAGDVTRFPSLGENAARDTRKTPVDRAKARALFQQWVDSPSHRKALVSRSYQFVSTGVIQRGTSIWAVQIFYATPRQKGLFQ